MTWELNSGFLCRQGGDLHCEEQASALPPLLLQWVKTDHALVMLFNNGTLQVSANHQYSCDTFIKLELEKVFFLCIFLFIMVQFFYTSSCFLLFRSTFTQTTQRSLCASRPTTPTCSRTSVESVSRTHTSSACWRRWAARLSCVTDSDTWSSCSSTTRMPESTALCRPGSLSDTCLRGSMTSSTTS